MSRQIQAHFDLADVPALVEAHGYRWCRGYYAWTHVEPRLRRALAEQALKAPQLAREFWDWFFGWRGLFGSDDVEVLELLAQSRIFSDLWIAGAELWRIRPDRARELAATELQRRCRVGLVCRSAPATGLREVSGEIRDCLQRRPPPWLRPLLRSHAVSGGPIAELAFDGALEWKNGRAPG